MWLARLLLVGTARPEVYERNYLDVSADALLGAAALFVALTRPRWRAAIVVLGTVPLVGWFAATPWNSGPPFLVASLVAPAIAAAALLAARRRTA